jgi:hypothetical protein
MTVEHTRQLLYQHAAKEVVLSFGNTCHTYQSTSSTDDAVVCQRALPLIVKYWRGTSSLKTHDPIWLNLQVSMTSYMCLAWKRVPPLLLRLRVGQVWPA